MRDLEVNDYTGANSGSQHMKERTKKKDLLEVLDHDHDHGVQEQVLMHLHSEVLGQCLEEDDDIFGH